VTHATGFAALALALVLFLAPAVSGMATRTKSFLTGRRGAPVLQPYYDIWKLFRRGLVLSRTTTWIFRLAPIVGLSTALLAATLFPLDGRASLLRFGGDAVAFAGLLALGRFVMILASLDTGSSFEGMGASREATFGSLVEVGVFLSFATLSVVTQDLSLSGMFGQELAARWSGVLPPLLMVGASLFALMLAECARVPVDDPATHLELTMIHEVMVLDHSGPDLALIVYGSALKLSVFGAMVIGVLVPRGSLSPLASIGVLAGGLLLVGVGVGIVESTMARLRLPRVPLYLASGSALALVGLVLVLR
jgi:formate hydrogenlyase subunit 4